VTRAKSSAAADRKAPARFCVVSLNPAIDVEWRVDDLRWEEKNLITQQRRWAGGKGANVARWLNFLGGDCELLIPLGGNAGRELARHLRHDRIRAHVVAVSEETRTNVVITSATGRQMRFNQPGAQLNAANWRAIVTRTQNLARRRAAIVLSGSLAPGLAPESYAKILRAVRSTGVRTFVDCDGETLKRAVRERPFLVKPNRHELSQWIGRSLPSLKKVREAAFEMSRVTRSWVLVSLSEDGLMLVNAAERFAERLCADHMDVVNTLGAGDATLAAAAHAVVRGAAPREWLRAALIAGTAATQLQPGRIPSRDLWRRIGSRIP
jgi:1-phosphofructokinase family hexose kinase